ncbi:hepatoma-derived growth factor-related protein 2-like [Eriocheir sinensis]|uniref:hepatoma-derived growth factor-related protein 2-like n=1 Tax=Eriocheir sinensis TaxID=95602 RepID=UPI0021CA488A|nr:hepatoma-derived growth factor-related protein 2-like [Eriocheir sinensis]XP_050695818.1 hepatoma-derived growth factor-related protein 2-like [Eriocheir sinensis]XP_050695819.1 hepatoma-derived growth factor-related protein 2-like [Eriocheir sinensis]XP_050695821.1 hepatoma-derived growth factor-related protein 2-like [Eriocheir sinensis]
MDESQNIRCSSRRRIRPVEFWNFEKPEDSVSEIVTYNQSELTRCSVFQPFSRSYQVTPKRSKGTKGNQTATRKNDHTTLENVTHSTKSQRKEGDSSHATLTRETTTHSSKSQGKEKDSTNHAKRMLQTTSHSVTSQAKEDSNLARSTLHNTAHSSEPQGKKTETNDARPHNGAHTLASLPGKNNTAPTLPKSTHPSQPSRKRRLENGEAEEEVTRLTDEDPARPAKPPGKRSRLKNIEDQDKLTTHSDEHTRTIKLPSKPNNQEPIRNTQGLTLSDEQGHSSRLSKENGNVGDKEHSNGEDSARVDVEGVTHPHKKRKRKLDGNSWLSSDKPTSSQSKRGRKQKEHEEPQTKDTASIPTPSGEGLNGEVPPILAGLDLKYSNKEGDTTAGLPPSSPPRHPTGPHPTPHTTPHQARDTTTGTPNLTSARDITSNITSNITGYEQPSFQNVFSSTALDVFKKPHPPFRRRAPPLALKVSSMFLDPSMVTIPEEEEEDREQKRKEGERQRKETDKNGEREKEELLRKRKEEEGKNKEGGEWKEMERQEKGELQRNRKMQEQEEEEEEEEEEEREETENQLNKMKEEEQRKRKNKLDEQETERNKEREKKKNEEKEEEEKDVRKKKTKPLSVGNSDIGSDTDDTTARRVNSDALRRGPARETPSGAVPSDPPDQERRTNPTQDNTRLGAPQNCRRSTRVRMQPLEFWNFEKVEVTRQADGEVQIIHQKQDPDFQSIQSRVVDCSMACRSQLGLGVTLTADLLGNAPFSRALKGKNKVRKTGVGSPVKDRLGNAPKETRDEETIQGQPSEERTGIASSGSPKRKDDTGKPTAGSPDKPKRGNATQSGAAKRKDDTGKLTVGSPDKPKRGNATQSGAAKRKNKSEKSTKAPTRKGRRKISPIKSTGDGTSRHPALSPSRAKGRVNAQELLAAWSPNRSPVKSPSKRQLFSPQDDFLDTPVEEESTFRRRTKGGMMVVQIKKFKDTQFTVIERSTYRCYLAQGLRNEKESIYTGFVFLEWGQVVWNTTRKTTVYVIEGLGSLKCLNEDSDASFTLKPRNTVELNKRLKVSIKKDGRCKLLKLHIVLGPHL